MLRFLIDQNFLIPQELVQAAKQILVVDDERALAEVTVRALQQDGYQLGVVFDGYEAGLRMPTLQSA